MSSMSRWSCLAASAMVVLVLAVALGLPGCSPAPSSESVGLAPEPATTLATEPAAEPTTEPAMEPATEPAAEPAAEPAMEPAMEPATEPAAEPAAEPAMEPATEPAKELATEPAKEPATEPAKEPAAEPAKEPATEPATEPAAGDSATAKVSEYAPAEDLVGQVDYYLGRLVDSVASEDAYKEAVSDESSKVAKDSNTLAVLALVLGLHDQDNKYKAAAPALLKASRELATTKDFASALAGVVAVKAAAADTSGSAAELKWEKVASLPELMKQVPLVSTKLKRYVARNRVKESTGYSALIAAIAEGAIYNSGDTEKPTEVQKWQQLCIEMRTAAGDVNTAVRAGDKAATLAAMERLAKSCDDCHTVFHEEQLGKDNNVEE